MSTPTTSTHIYKGLAGVVVDTTAISKVVPETNSLTYRGYPVQDLSAHCSFEQVAYLLWHGELPTDEQLREFEASERGQRDIDADLLDVITKLPTTSHPMDVVRTAVSFLGASDPTESDTSEESNLAKSLRLLAVLPTIVAVDLRRRRGQEPIAPNPELGFAANFLNMSFGEVPAPELVKAFEVSLILYAEHSFNASTFAARVVTSTTSDIYSAVTAGIGALKGKLHGGANEAVMHDMAEIGDPAKAEAWMKDKLSRKEKVMGFGHRVYKNGDSRVPTMKQAFIEVAERTDGQKFVEMYEILERTMVDATGIKPNLDFPTGPAYHLLGFDTEIFTPIFVMARITGWTAHIIEQTASNALIRPLSEYVGVPQRAVED